MTSIDFHDAKNRYSYAARSPHNDWQAAVGSLVAVTGKRAVDIGCGGGIYTRALSEMGAYRVTGVDNSRVMLAGAAEASAGYENVIYVGGDADSTGLPAGEADIVLERALIHHLTELTGCFAEAYRLLSSGAMLLVQDRTPEDCLLPGSVTHLRGYIFERFPRLIERERARRHSSEAVRAAMVEAGFASVRSVNLWETRRVYDDTTELRADLLARTGRSILHELSDAELADLTEYMIEQVSAADGPYIERDRWTIWMGDKTLGGIQ